MPRRHPDSKTRIVGVRLTETDYRRIYDLAASEERPMTAQIRKILRQGLAQQETDRAAAK